MFVFDLGERASFVFSLLVSSGQRSVVFEPEPRALSSLSGVCGIGNCATAFDIGIQAPGKNSV